MPEVDDEREASERENERGPDAAAHRLLRHEPRPERDEHGREVLDEESDPDLKPVDREEVEPLDGREPEDAEDEEEEDLTATDSEPPRLGDEQRRSQGDRGPGRAHLGEARRGEPGAEDRLRDGAVDAPHSSRGEHHRVAEQRSARTRFRLRGEDRLYHSQKLSDYTCGPGFGV
jgi:hypothetical protein